VASRNTTTTAGFDRDKFIAALTELIESVFGSAVGSATPEPEPEAKAAPAAKGKSLKKSEPEPEPEPEQSPFEAREAKLNGMTLKALRTLAVTLNFNEDEVSGADKDTLVASILDQEFDEDGNPVDDGGDGDGEPEDGDGDGDGGYITEEDMQKMSLAELRELATEYGVSFSPSARKPGLIQAIIESAGSEEE
jgi:hypothetical protein